MELLGLLAMLVVTGLLIVPAVLAILALVRLHELRTRLDRSQAEQAQQRLDTLERRLQRLERVVRDRQELAAGVAAADAAGAPAGAEGPARPVPSRGAEWPAGEGARVAPGTGSAPPGPGAPRPPDAAALPGAPFPPGAAAAGGAPLPPGAPLPEPPPLPAAAGFRPPAATAAGGATVPSEGRLSSAPSGATPAAPAPPPPPASAIDWERWLGLRGAAVLGAAALALAGLLFFQYSIQHGLITPAMRVVIGVAVGAGCMLASEILRPRGYRYTAEGLGGAGAVILYAAFWSAHALYELIGLGTSFGLMAAVTAACCVLSVRSGTQTVASLGLVGGFATPLILKSEVDRTLGLFGYILLLDVGLLAVGWKRRWPWLGALSLAGTVLIQALWVGSRMGPSRLLLAVAMLGLFALLFAAAGEFAPVGNPRERRAWVASQAGAILLPFTFALYFAGRTDFGPRLLPVALLLALLAAAAGWIGRAQGARWLGTGAAAGCVVTTGLWLAQRPLSTSGAWEAAGVAAGLALIFHIFVELDPASDGADGPAPAAVIAAAGFVLLFFLVAGLAPQVSLPPLLAAWLVLAAILYRHASFPGRGALQVAGAAGAAFGISLFRGARFGSGLALDPAAATGLALGVAGLAMAAAWIRRDAEKRAFALHAAAVAALLLMPLPIWTPLLRGIGAGQGVAATIVLGLVALVAATLLRSGRWYACATAATVLVLSAWTLLHTAAAGTADPLRQFLRLAPGGAPASFGLSPSRVLLALLLQGVAVVLFTAWPLRARAAFEADRWAGRAAALAGPALFWPMKVLWSARLGDGAIGLLPLLLGAVSLAAALAERRARPSPDSPGLSRLVWFSGARFSSPPSPSRCSSRGSGSRSAGPSRARPSSCSGSGSITRASSGSRWASCPPRP